MLKSLAAVILLAIASAAHAADPVPTTPCGDPIPGFMPCTLVTSGYAGSVSLFKPGKNKEVVAFSRMQGDLLTGIGKLHLVARIDTSAQSDGATKGTPDSFQSIEVRGALYYPISSAVSLAAIGGASAPLLPADGIVQKYPVLMGGGFMLGSPRSKTWVLLAAGVDDAAGKGVKFLFAAQIRLKGNVFFVADGAWGGAGSFARSGSALGTN